MKIHYQCSNCGQKFQTSAMDDLISRQAAIDAADDMVEPQESEEA